MFEMKPLACEPTRLKGLSEKLIVSHYENNYGGAVKRLSQIAEYLGNVDLANAPGFVINGLKREELIATNSMILHEIYFAGLGATDQTKDMTDALTRDFGSAAQWQAQFSAMGKAQGGGSGWVLLTYSARTGRLVNQWAADHTTTIADGVVILALDMFEHSYHIDYGAKAAAYVDAYMQNINWAEVAKRYARATRASLNAA
jgi:superoxide dismutase, Fe-Mn family